MPTVSRTGIFYDVRRNFITIVLVLGVSYEYSST